MPSFQLRKWYLDVADTAGNAWIGYHASLDWGALHVDFTHQLQQSPADGVREHGEFRAVPEPCWDDADTLAWNVPGTDASWRRERTPTITETLLENAEGRLLWSCVLPRAQATVRTPLGTIEGTGYAERIELTIEPWRLPISALHWGRCHGTKHDLVWIRWEGAEPGALAWLDGVRRDAVEITETRVRADGVTWECGERATLRRGTIGRTPLAPLGALGALTGRLPAAALALDEHKWLAPGRLTVDGASEDAQSIAERVGW